MNIKILLIYSLLYFCLFAVSEIAFVKFKVHVELTRKFVHVCTGLIALTFPFYLADLSEVVALCGLFFVLLIIIKKWKILPSIMAVKRKTYGSLFFPLTVVACYYFSDRYNSYLLYFLPLMILSICDPMASIVGKRFRIGKYTVFGNTKTIIGSLAFLVCALIICACGFYWFPINSHLALVVLALIVSFVSTGMESISVTGWDNFTVPMSVLIILCLSLS